MKNKRTLAAGILTASIALTLGTGVAGAAAATVSTSISVWGVGDVGSWRASTGAAQGIQLSYCAANFQNNPNNYSASSAQMQLQRQNGVAVESMGNRTNACGGAAQSWGTVPSGNYRYQLNGATVNGSWSGGGTGLTISSNPVTITY